MEKHKKSLKNTVFLICNIAVSLLFLFFTYRLWEKDFRIPIVYSGGDGVGGLLTIKKAIEGKGFVDFDFFCAPYGEKLYSQEYFFPYLVVKFITLFTSDVGIASNLFWIATYILTAITMYIFLKRLGCNWITIIVGSTIYNFLPYHYFRLEHYWLMGCYIVPLVGYMVIEVLDAQNAEINSRKKKCRGLVHFIFALIIGLNGLYYSVFSIMVLTITIFYSMLYKKRYQAIKKYLIDCIGIVLPIIFLYAIPLALSGTNELSNIASERDISQINAYGLNLILLFLPIPGHRISLFSDFTKYCYEQMNIASENFTESLGVVMAIGVIISVLFAFKNLCDQKWEDRIRDFGILILIIFIIATLGGVDNFIAIFISASIRCYNRLSIYIALFAIGTICLLLEQLGNWLREKNVHYVFGGICIGVTIIGVLDVTSANFSKYETYNIYTREYVYSYDEIKEEYNNDVAFFEEISDELDEEKMLFIAPYNADTTKYGQKGYFHRIKTFIVQPEIKTSFSFFDEKYTKWWTEVSKSNIETQVKLMSVLGYSGILLDETSFTSDEERDNYIESISEYIDENSEIISANGNLRFYSIKEWKNKFLGRYSDEELETWRENIYLNIYYNEYESVDIDDLHGLEENNVVKAGTTQYGPYYTLEPGNYQILLKGSNLSAVNIWVTADGGDYQIPITNLQVFDDYIQYEVSLDKKYEKIEFLAESDQDFKVYKYYYASKTDVELVDIVRVQSKLSQEFGLGYYEQKLSLDSFYINGNGKILSNEIILNSNSTQYGPYLYLVEGAYQVTVCGSGLDNVDFRVTAESGQETMECAVIEQSDNELVYEFELNASANGVEFLIESGNDNVYIEEYMLSYKVE